MPSNEQDSDRLDRFLAKAEIDASAVIADAAREVGYVETPAGLFVGWIDVAWQGPAHPRTWLRGVIHIPERESPDLWQELERARKKRKRALRRCKYCGELNIPGHMLEQDVCQGCGTSELGVVY